MDYEYSQRWQGQTQPSPPQPNYYPGFQQSGLSSGAVQQQSGLQSGGIQSSGLQSGLNSPGLQSPNISPGVATSLHRTSSSLSLNLSSLSVASPTALSPIVPSSGATSALSSGTPISPATYTHGHHLHPYQFVPPSDAPDGHNHGHPYEHESNAGYEGVGVNVPSSPHSTTSTLPRKRSFSADPGPGPMSTSRSHTPSSSISISGPPAPPSLRITTDTESLRASSPTVASAHPTSASYDDMDLGLVSAYDATSSPIDGSGSSGEEAMLSGGPQSMSSMPHSSAGGGKIIVPSLVPAMGILGKPLATNNFVTKLYQMINDQKSAHFIAWTELGTSFVVSNVGEFSRSILGSHFKHNNFSSFVRQLNMYGFHKINRTPRAQRTTSDAQTWEFSHHKFLRGRPDLLDEIKRKALEPDPAQKHRVELPGEVAAQLSSMREDNQRMWEQLNTERRRVERLISVVGKLWDIVGKGFAPGTVPQFPMEMLEPNIFVTSPRTGYDASPPATEYQPSAHSHPHSHPHPHSHSHSLSHSVQTPSHSHSLPTPHLSRQSSFPHLFRSSGSAGDNSPLPASPSEMSMSVDVEFDDRGDGHGESGRKRQRMMSADEAGMGSMSVNVSGLGMSGQQHSGMNGSNTASPHPHHANSMDSLSPPKPRASRARSDSAPLGGGAYNMHTGGSGLGPWSGSSSGRPRSGSGMAHVGVSRMGNISGSQRTAPGGALNR
ncbi:unnamed protein product [Mycena citricolor]|uniref:HSF-type DNA-binding domain-containing protein n=2 Tax=Mycena citricolor TaxID=2018698 RepID=A0AAD2K1M3_9AGAR|nr:unnamed protein product [Mycena citricolor]CAK5267382.1 unnamed protein product [Mycena citricolor]CAK5273789.1 unnamed protein product [Mycena citricolor]